MTLNLNSIAVSANRPMPPTRPKTIHTEPPALVVFGKDDGGKPHASWFDAEEAPLATKAAGMMGMVALPVDSDDIRGLAVRLPHGKVFASGRAFVPFVKADLFDTLVGHMPDPKAWPAKPDRGLMPAQRPAKPSKGAGGAARAAGGGAEAASAPKARPTKASGVSVPGQIAIDEPKPSYPKDWSSIASGDVVLACEVGEGWFECKVLEVKPGALFTLQWRDWPELPQFVRKAEHIALMHPDFAI